ncbi:hypothetical protein [Streptomyces synnematoformans]|uniref:Cysteine-rich CPCC domain-containing protein n=1 Tax=Streptomyces synnematoformans TaxID=415721 RepID=A0ABN2XAX3_9ACTN
MKTTPCPAACGRQRAAGHYLCTPCWWHLPMPARGALRRKDTSAMARLQELHTQLAGGVPLADIRISP